MGWVHLVSQERKVDEDTRTLSEVKREVHSAMQRSICTIVVFWLTVGKYSLAGMYDQGLITDFGFMIE